MENRDNLLAVLQISDSGFPTGGFSHSGGLEAAIKVNNVFSKETLKTFLYCSMENMGSFLLPFMKEAYQGFCDGDLARLDELCDISTANHVARRASTRQGRSMLDTSIRVFKLSTLEEHCVDLPFKHYPVVYGAVCAALNIDLDSACSAFLFSGIRTVIASAVRLDVVGPIEAQCLQRELQSELPKVIDRHGQRWSEDACMVFPHVDVLQNVHDTMFSKLFYS